MPNEHPLHDQNWNEELNQALPQAMYNTSDGSFSPDG